MMATRVSYVSTKFAVRSLINPDVNPKNRGYLLSLSSRRHASALSSSFCKIVFFLEKHGALIKTSRYENKDGQLSMFRGPCRSGARLTGAGRVVSNLSHIVEDVN